MTHSKHLKKKLREALEQKLEDLDEEKRNISVVETKKVFISYHFFVSRVFSALDFVD